MLFSSTNNGSTIQRQSWLLKSSQKFLENSCLLMFFCLLMMFVCFLFLESSCLQKKQRWTSCYCKDCQNNISPKWEVIWSDFILTYKTKNFVAFSRKLIYWIYLSCGLMLFLHWCASFKMFSHPLHAPSPLSWNLMKNSRKEQWQRLVNWKFINWKTP